MRDIMHLARQIELLSPAVDDGGRRPDNCEYPWAISSTAVSIPALHNFSRLSLLTDPVGRSLLKYVHAAIEELIAASRR